MIYNSKLGRLLSILLLMVKKFSRLINSCDQAMLTEMGGKVKEIQIHEKNLDILIDLFKRDQLDQSVSLEQLGKAIRFNRSIIRGLLEVISDNCRLLGISN